MTAPGHPPIERLADLHQGLLDAQEARTVADHVAACPVCSSTTAALDDVRALLAEEGRRPLPMPDVVERAITAAVDQAATNRTVTSLSAAREARRRRGRLLPALIGAAATVLTLVAGGAAYRAVIESGAGSQAGAGESLTDSADAASKQQTDPEGGSAAPNSQSELPRLSAGSVDAYAERLAGGSVVPVAPRECPSASSDAVPLNRQALVRYEGRRAVLQLHPDARRAVVTTCATPPRVLHRSTY